MNWLAHLRLSPDRSLLRLGNLAGDFVQGVDLASLHPELQRGVQLHRAIDRFVDAHPRVVAARAALPESARRLGGVLLDVWFDHFLARDWGRWGDGGSLADFHAAVCADLRQHAAELPEPLRRVTPHFCTEAWLLGYPTLPGLQRVFEQMAARRPKLVTLATGSQLLGERYEAISADFAALWPELTTFAANASEASE